MLRWGIIGLGSIAQQFALDLARLPGHSLQAVASRSKEKADLFAQLYPAHTAHASYQALFEDAAVDIVYIATPHDSHMALSIQAMEHAKHVLCEKPLAITAQQVQLMLAAAQQHKVFLMEALWSRFNPSIVAVLDRIQNDEIGEVNYINADFCFNKVFDPNHRLFNPNLAGGALLDVGIYPLFLSYLILGQPKSIQSVAIKHSNGIDLQTSALLIYPKASAILNFGFLNNAEMVGRINGSEGSIHLHKRWHEAKGYTLLKAGTETHYSIPPLGKGYSHEILECGECISNGQLESQKWTHQDSLKMAEMMDTIRKQCGIVYPFE